MVRRSGSILDQGMVCCQMVTYVDLISSPLEFLVTVFV